MSGETVSEFFDSYAEQFNALYGTSEGWLNRFVNRYFRKSMRLRFEASLRGCEPVEGKSVVDVGCGPGHYARALALKGAERVVGVDFSESMIELAREKAQSRGVESQCEFVVDDFLEYEPAEPFDHAIVMGVMDYIEDPREFVEAVLAVTEQSAFFSFPVDGGLLAWQRKIRYKFRCQLFMYDRDQIEELFDGLEVAEVEIEKMARDFFVTAHPS